MVYCTIKIPLLRAFLSRGVKILLTKLGFRVKFTISCNSMIVEMDFRFFRSLLKVSLFNSS